MKPTSSSTCFNKKLSALEAWCFVVFDGVHGRGEKKNRINWRWSTYPEIRPRRHIARKLNEDKDDFSSEPVCLLLLATVWSNADEGAWVN